MNSILTLQPYFYAGTWVFDDERFGLVKEAFVAGAENIITRMVKGIPNAHTGFRLTFSANPFPGYDIVLDRMDTEHGGNWYRCEEYDMVGWLCPALYHYFESAPDHIYAKAEEAKKGNG